MLSFFPLKEWLQALDEGEPCPSLQGASSPLNPRLVESERELCTYIEDLGLERKRWSCWILEEGDKRRIRLCRATLNPRNILSEKQAVKGGLRWAAGVRFDKTPLAHLLCVRAFNVLHLFLCVYGLVFAEVMKVAGPMWRQLPAHEKAVGCRERRESR